MVKDNSSSGKSRPRMRLVNARVPDDLRVAIDAYAAEHDMDRSTAIREGLARLVERPDLAGPGRQAA